MWGVTALKGKRPLFFPFLRAKREASPFLPLKFQS
jgi:hypothetical protein